MNVCLTRITVRNCTLYLQLLLGSIHTLTLTRMCTVTSSCRCNRNNLGLMTGLCTGPLMLLITF